MNPNIFEDMEKMPRLLGFLPTVMMALGFGVSYLFYMSRPDLPVELARTQPMLYRFLLNKWYFDELYDLIFVRTTKWLGTLSVEGRGWLHHRRLRTQWHLRAGARRHPQRGAAADRLSLSLCFRDADRGCRIDSPGSCSAREVSK